MNELKLNYDEIENQYAEWLLKSPHRIEVNLRAHVIEISNYAKVYYQKNILDDEGDQCNSRKALDCANTILIHCGQNERRIELRMWRKRLKC